MPETVPAYNLAGDTRPRESRADGLLEHQTGDEPLADLEHPRRWWEVVIMLLAAGIFVWLAVGTRAQHIYVNIPWMLVLMVGTIVPLWLVGTMLWRRTRFS